MTTHDLFQETITALGANKGRAGLTMLGIVIGIASVIAMVGIGNGAQASITQSINSLGSNLLTIRPGASSSGGVRSARGSSQTLTKDDATAIAGLQNINAVAPEADSNAQIVVGGNNTNATVDGTMAAYASVHNVSMDEGTFITDSHVASRAKVAVLGPTVRDDLFGTGAQDAVGQKVRINGTEFTVIGIMTSKGGSGFGSTDEEVFIPLSTAQLYLSGGKYVSSIGVQVASADAMTGAEDDITSLLLGRHHITNPDKADFSIVNQADILSTASSITGTFTALLAAIAGISLIVGGIGIMNMMLTSVTERTREIGLRKAVGAREEDISRQFLMESLALTLIGGGIGIALGWLIATVISLTGVVSAVVSLSSVLLAFGVSAAIGIGFGWYPARRAAKLKPIDALRYE